MIKVKIINITLSKKSKQENIDPFELRKQINNILKAYEKKKTTSFEDY